MSFCITLFDKIENPGVDETCFVTATSNMTLNKGSAYKIIYTITKNNQPVDLSGYSLRGQIRPSASSSTVLLNMTTANLLLELDINNSKIIMNLPEKFTRRVSGTFAVYDIELINNLAQASKIVQGLMTFVAEVTQ
jgi:hypothetical protein